MLHTVGANNLEETLLVVKGDAWASTLLHLRERKDNAFWMKAAIAKVNHGILQGLSLLVLAMVNALDNAVDVAILKIVAKGASAVLLCLEDDGGLCMNVTISDETTVGRLAHCLPCCVAMDCSFLTKCGRFSVF